ERSRAARLDEVATHAAGGSSRRWIAHVARLDARIGERDRLGARVLGQERLRHGQPPDRQHAGPLEELAPVDAAVTVLVVELVDALIDLDLGHPVRHGWPPWLEASF